MDSTSSDPNQPPTVSSNDLFEVDAKNRIAFAGIWLIVLGCVDLVVVALFAREIPFGVILWSALILVLFGILVAARFRSALVAVRLLGAIAIVSLIIVSLILVRRREFWDGDRPAALADCIGDSVDRRNANTAVVVRTTHT